MASVPKWSTYSLCTRTTVLLYLNIQSDPSTAAGAHFTKTGLSPVSTEVCCWVLGSVLTSMAGLNLKIVILSATIVNNYGKLNHGLRTVHCVKSLFAVEAVLFFFRFSHLLSHNYTMIYDQNQV